MYECIRLCVDVRFCVNATNLVIDAYFTAISVKCCRKWRVKRVKCTLWCWNSTLPKVYFCLILCSDIVSRYSDALHVSYNPSLSPLIRLSSSKLEHRLGCREMLKMKSFGCSLLWYCKLLLASHRHTPSYMCNIYTHTWQICVLMDVFCDRGGPLPLPQCDRQSSSAPVLI